MVVTVGHGLQVRRKAADAPGQCTRQNEGDGERDDQREERAADQREEHRALRGKGGVRLVGEHHRLHIQIFDLRAVDRRWLLKDITNLIAQEDAYVLEINSDNLRESGRVQLRLRLKVNDYGQLSTLLGKLDALPGVDDARRLG